MSDWITSDHLASRLKVKATTIKRWTRAGAIPCIKLSGKVIRYDYDEVINALRDAAKNRRAARPKLQPAGNEPLSRKETGR